MFIIYRDRAAWKEFKRFFIRDGDKFFVRLAGINISSGVVEPIYQPLLRVWSAPGNLYVELPHTLFILMRRKPYLYMERTNRTEVEDDSD